MSVEYISRSRITRLMSKYPFEGYCQIILQRILPSVLDKSLSSALPIECVATLSGFCQSEKQEIVSYCSFDLQLYFYDWNWESFHMFKGIYIPFLWKGSEGLHCLKWVTSIFPCFIYLLTLLLVYYYHKLLQVIEYSSLCYIVGPCCLPILYISMCIC